MWPSFTDVATAAVLGLVGILLGTMVLSVIRIPERRLVRRHFLLSSLVRLVLTFVYFGVLLAAGRGGFALSDDGNYHLWGSQLAEQSGAAFGVDLPLVNNPGYIWWSAFLYKLFGPNTLIVRVVNVVVVGSWLIPTAILAGQYGSREVTRRAIILVAWMPSLALISVLQVKDPIAGLAIMLVPAMLTNYCQPWVRFSVAVCSILVLWYIRVDMVPALFIVAMGSLLITSRDAGHMLRTAILGLALVVAAGLLLPDYFNKAYGSAISSTLVAGDVDALLRKTSEATEDASFLKLFAITSASDVWKLPFSMAATLALPFPSEYRSQDPHPFVAGLANMPFILLIPFLGVGLWEMLRRHAVPLFPLYATALIGLAMIAIAGLGVLRYRDNFLGFLLIMVSVGWQVRDRRRGVLLASIGTIMAATLFYAATKVA